MASVTEPAPPPIEEAPRTEELLVDKQIQRTRRALKIVDLTSGMIGLLIGVLLFLLAAAALEHWVIPGGWSGTARAILFAIFMLGVAWYSWRIFWPLLSHPINPAYAAQAIEKSSPTLKNSLLNFLLLRHRRRQLSRQVYQAIEQQAAQRLSEVPPDSAVDRSAIIRLGYVLVGIVALCALYRVLSPKDMIASATRVLNPWSNVPAPSRVLINDIEPGDTSVARGEQLEVSAEISGLKEDEPVRLRYSTADQQIIGQEINMAAPRGDGHYQCRLPGRISPGEGGIQQDLSYWIEAGDARSSEYKVTVYARPTLVVQRVHYNYPDYTGYASREETNTGDIRAVEGTVVTLEALANQPIEKAHVDFEADGRHDNLMKAEDRQATVSFPLELREDRRTPRYQSYVLRYTTSEGKQNQLPPKYQIEVTPDYSPEIRLLTPEEDIVEVAIDEEVTIELEARDPDFAIRNVSVLGEVAGEQVLKEVLLDENHTGRFVGRMQLTPRDLGLKPGDVLQYWGAAADNRQPEANLSFTAHRKIRVVGPGKGGGEGERQQEGEGQQPGEEAAEGKPSESAEGEGQGESAEGTQGETGQGQEGAGQDSQGESGEGQQSKGQGGSGEGPKEGQPNQSEPENGAGGDSSGDQHDDSEQKDQSGEQSSDPSGEQGDSQDKVSPAGDDDGEAFERIAEHLNEQDNQQGQSGNKKPDSGESGERGRQTENDRQPAESKREPEQSGEGADANEEEAVDDPEGAPGEQRERSSEGPGAEGEQSPPQKEHGEQQGDDAQDQQAPGGEMSPEHGPAGEGNNPGENQGSPDVRGDKKPREKQSDPSGDAQQNDQEAPIQGEGQTESDSKGSQGGDRSGGGQEGAGQQADAEGTGGAGKNQAADEGSGQSAQQGEGETSKQPGGSKQADGKTGESSQNQPGGGSKESDKKGDQPGGANFNGQGKNQNGTAPGDGQQKDAEQPSDQKPSDREGSPDASGQQPLGGGTGGKSSPPPPGEIQPGDEANLEYARKQTELVLDKLDDQLKKKEVDEGLLEKLGWNQDELRRFVDRWKNLKDQATGESASAEAQQELNDALRSLGLNRNSRTGFRARTAKDKLRDLQDAYRGRTPLEYQEQLRAYVKGTATAEEE